MIKARFVANENYALYKNELAFQGLRFKLKFINPVSMCMIAIGLSTNIICVWVFVHH